MSYLVEQQQQERISLPPSQQAQSMQLNVSFDTTGYPIAPIPQNQAVTVSATSKNNSMLVAGALVGALVCSGAIGHYLGASGEAQKTERERVESVNMRSDFKNLCDKYPK